MRLHVVSLPHTQTTAQYLSCAYTQKVVRFGKMMRALGYEVVIYGGTENEAECDEFVTVVTDEDRERWFGPHDPNAFYPITWDPNDEHWQSMNRAAIAAIQERRVDKHDLLLLIAGCCQQQIAAGLPGMTACEWGVGYEGIFADYCAFESAAWRHYIYGRRNMIDGRFYDAVIPNFFDTGDFGLQKKDDYLLFIGRLVLRKGPHVAAEIAARAGKRLLVAGPGAVHVEPGRIVAPEVTITGDHVEYVGPVGLDERAHLMARAQATLVPTQYIEPFGGVAVESMLSGTPVVATDWGAFSETVVPGVSGGRFSTLQEAADIVESAQYLNPADIRAWAADRYGLDAVGRCYDRWFQQLDGLWGEGWYS